MAWSLPYTAYANPYPNRCLSAKVQPQPGQVRNYFWRPNKFRVRITDVPADEDAMLVFTNEAPSTPITFEWDDGDGVAPGHVPVAIGIDKATCTANLRAAIDATLGPRTTDGATAFEFYLCRTFGTAGGPSWSTIVQVPTAELRWNAGILNDRAARIGPRLAVTALGNGVSWYDPSPAPPVT